MARLEEDMEVLILTSIVDHTFSADLKFLENLSWDKITFL